MILGYVRVSSADQAKDDRSSLQTQTDVIEGFARTRGVDKWGVQIFTDAGVSGATKLAFRPAGAELLKTMQKGDIVIASKLDRMFRSASDALNMFDAFKEQGVDLVLYDMSAESVLESATAKLTVTILAAVAEMERVRIRERTAEGRKAKKARGSAVLEVNEDECRAREMMKELYYSRKGYGYHAIAGELAAQGLVSRAGKPFTRMAIRRVILQDAVQ